MVVGAGTRRATEDGGCLTWLIGDVGGQCDGFLAMLGRNEGDRCVMSTVLRSGVGEAS